MREAHKKSHNRRRICIHSGAEQSGSHIIKQRASPHTDADGRMNRAYSCSPRYIYKIHIRTSIGAELNVYGCACLRASVCCTCWMNENDVRAHNTQAIRRCNTILYTHKSREDGNRKRSLAIALVWVGRTDAVQMCAAAFRAYGNSRIQFTIVEKSRGSDRNHGTSVSRAEWLARDSSSIAAPVTSSQHFSTQSARMLFMPRISLNLFRICFSTSPSIRTFFHFAHPLGQNAKAAALVHRTRTQNAPCEMAIASNCESSIWIVNNEYGRWCLAHAKNCAAIVAGAFAVRTRWEQLRHSTAQHSICTERRSHKI